MPSGLLNIQSVNWDRIGIGTSSLCMVHCLLMPLVLAFSPAIAHFLPGNEIFHRTLAYLLAGIGLLAFHVGYKVHRRKLVLVLLAAGIAGITVGAYANLPSHRWEVAITFIGGGFLIVAHSMNRTLRRSCGACARAES